MELTEVIKNRRSIRHFNKEKLSQETIKKILTSGLLAPSAKNRQPWSFIVITDKDLKKEIGDLLETKTPDETNLTCEVIRESEALILVYGDIEHEVFDTISIGACIENMILEAYNLNVGSLWIGFILQIEKELNQKFNTNKKLISAVALGYTDSFPKARPRKTLEECTKWY